MTPLFSIIININWIGYCFTSKVCPILSTTIFLKQLSYPTSLCNSKSVFPGCLMLRPVIMLSLTSLNLISLASLTHWTSLAHQLSSVDLIHTHCSASAMMAKHTRGWSSGCGWSKSCYKLIIIVQYTLMYSHSWLKQFMQVAVDDYACSRCLVDVFWRFWSFKFPQISLLDPALTR